VLARELCRISPPRFLAKCHEKRPNQGSFILLLFAFSGLCLVFVVSVFDLSFVTLRSRSNSISDTSKHSEESDIRSLTDSDRYHVRLVTTLLQAHCKRSESRLLAFGSLRGNDFVSCGRMEVVRQLFILTSPELCIFA